MPRTSRNSDKTERTGGSTIALVKPRILLVEDEEAISEPLAEHLERDGFAPEVAATIAEARDAYDRETPDLILLDVMLPDGDGRDLAREIRKESDVPIVMLTARGEEIDRVLGLEMGGDDYVTKPFSPRELVARIRAVLRRTIAHPPATGIPREVRHGRLRLDLESFHAFWDGTEVTLTVTEFGLLETLLRHPGRVYSRAELMESGYSDDRTVADRTIDSHIRRIRRKFEPLGVDPIETSPGRGYKAAPCD